MRKLTLNDGESRFPEITQEMLRAAADIYDRSEEEDWTSVKQIVLGILEAALTARDAGRAPATSMAEHLDDSSKDETVAL